MFLNRNINKKFIRMGWDVRQTYPYFYATEYRNEVAGFVSKSKM